MPHRTVADLGERELIRRITARLALPKWVVVGPGDDAAVVAPERGTLDVLTTDAQVEGVHFDRAFVPADAVGHRALAVNLSDLAAMGARPRAALLSLALPDAYEAGELDRLLDGLLALADAHRVAVIGGNISRSPGPLVVDVTALGSARPRRILRRSGARPGDHVYVTGWLGDAAAELRELQQAPAGAAPAPSRARGQYLAPQPRVRAGLLLAGYRAASACIDLSDGLADGVQQLAHASDVGIVLDADCIPVAARARAWHERNGGDPLATALAGGDDYELLFTVRPGHLGRLRGVRQQIGDLPITRIGVVTADRGLLIRRESGSEPLPQGYEHFR